MTLIISGLIFVFMGLLIAVQPVFYSVKDSMTFDFSNIKYPLSISVIAIGSYCIYIGTRSYSNEKYMVATWICPECEELFNLAEKDKHICPNCKISLELLEGFYERHSEKK